MNGSKERLNVLLTRAGILNKKSHRVLANYQNHDNLLNMVLFLNKANLLIQNNFASTVNHQSPEDLVRVLSSLYNTNLLNQENFTAAASHQNLYPLTWVLESLHSANLLNQDSFTVAVNHQSSYNLALALKSLHSANLLNQENFTAAVNHQNPYDLARVLKSLHSANLLNQENFTAAVNHNNPCYLAWMLESLHNTKLLNQENFTTIAQHQNIDTLKAILDKLQEHMTPGEVVIHRLIRHDNPSEITDSLVGTSHKKYSYTDLYQKIMAPSQLERERVEFEKNFLQVSSPRKKGMPHYHTSTMTYRDFMQHAHQLMAHIDTQLDREDLSVKDRKAYIELQYALRIEFLEIGSMSRHVKSDLTCADGSKKSDPYIRHLSDTKQYGQLSKTLSRRPGTHIGMNKEGEETVEFIDQINLNHAYTPSKRLMDHIAKNQQSIYTAIDRVKAQSKGRNPDAMSFFDKLVDIFKSLFTKPKPEHAQLKPATVWFNKCREAARKPQHSPEESPAMGVAY